MEQYEKEFETLLSNSIRYAAGISENVFVISIPDYGVTPFAKEKGLDESKIAAELDSYNSVSAKIAASKNTSFIDITPGSKKARADASLIAKDGLHPSVKMYAEWVDVMYNLIYDNLSTR